MTGMLRSIDELRAHRAVAMQRARHVRARGLDGWHIDVAIARRTNRMLLRLIRGQS